MEVISLEKHFNEICATHPHLKLLESQWQFDKELISKALQNVGTIFPHYSRHDASHSKQIIVNIERMLGDKIRFLTATDTWLLLEAAYTHDIGMVVTHKQIKDLNTPEFKLYLKDVIADVHSPLQKFAKQWESDKATLPQGALAQSFLNEYIQLIAEWYRRKHPENSARIIRNPLQEIGLDSPRNELLPKRLFSVLADICKMHGEQFEKVLELPFAEAGMGTEDCHPRYIACLLRMADLLDIDDNRFCPVMMGVYGKNLPRQSQAHVDKHHSIKHFRLNSERIEITSLCPTPASYEASFDWFQWLIGEYHNQTQHWDKICPSPQLGTLPTLTTPKVDIKSPYLILEAGKKPDFNVDKEALLSLVRGTGLYESKFNSIREILQNAVDATLIAAWMDHKSRIVGLDPASSELTAIMAHYPITVQCSFKEGSTEVLHLRISDCGVGIDLNSLRYMLNVGSSSKNAVKRNIIEEMPMWYKPSGTFGIGLQSCYLITNKFSMTTKGRVSNECLEIQFSKKHHKTVIIKKLTSQIPYGTTFDAAIKIEQFPKRISTPGFFGEDDISLQLGQYDFTNAESTLGFYEHIHILEAIRDFGANSPVPIIFDGELVPKEEAQYFSKKTSVSIANISFSSNSRSNLITAFRGQPFECKHLNIDMISGHFDFHGHLAPAMLSYNRDSALSDAHGLIEDEIVTTVLEYIEFHFERIPEEERPNAAAFYYLHSYPFRDFPGNFRKSLWHFKLHFKDNAEIKLSKVVSDVKSGQIPYLTQQGLQGDAPESLTLRYGARSTLPILVRILREQGYFYKMVMEEESGGSYKYIWSEAEGPIIEGYALLRSMARRNVLAHGFGKRTLFPCWGEFQALAVSNDIPWARRIASDYAECDYLVLPCSSDKHGYKVDLDEIFEEWVFTKLLNKDITRPRMHDLYQKLVIFLEEALNLK